MTRNSILRFRCLSLLPLCLAASAQVISSNQPAPQGPVSYSSASQMNALLAQLEEASQAAQLDLAKMRIEKWKTDSGSKRQAEGNAESIQRNLKTALPEIIAELKASPESLTFTFKLYRNLDALYDVFESVAESAGAFGSKDEFQALENDVSTFERLRRSVADRMETLAAAKEVEVTRLRTALQTAQANTPSAPPKKIVVDDEAPAKKPVKKKPAPKAAPATTAPVPPQPHRNRRWSKPRNFAKTSSGAQIHLLEISNILKWLKLRGWNSACHAGVYTYQGCRISADDRTRLTLGPRAERTYNERQRHGFCGGSKHLG